MCTKGKKTPTLEGNGQRSKYITPFSRASASFRIRFDQNAMNVMNARRLDLSHYQSSFSSERA